MLKVAESISKFFCKELPLEEFISEYRRIYQLGEELFSKYKPCSINNEGLCLRGQDGGCNFCCADCAYITDTGCSVEALWCKLWVCGAIKTYNKLPKEALKELEALNREAGQLCHHIGGRHDMGDFIEKIYSMEVYKEWKNTEVKSKSISAQSAS